MLNDDPVRFIVVVTVHALMVVSENYLIVKIPFAQQASDYSVVVHCCNTLPMKIIIFLVSDTPTWFPLVENCVQNHK